MGLGQAASACLTHLAQPKDTVPGWCCLGREGRLLPSRYLHFHLLQIHTEYTIHTQTWSLLLNTPVDKLTFSPTPVCFGYLCTTYLIVDATLFHSFIHSFIHSVIQSFSHSFIRSSRASLPS